jgi:hypothetical protein
MKSLLKRVFKRSDSTNSNISNVSSASSTEEKKRLDSANSNAPSISPPQNFKKTMSFAGSLKSLKKVKKKVSYRQPLCEVIPRPKYNEQMEETKEEDTENLTLRLKKNNCFSIPKRKRRNYSDRQYGCSIFQPGVLLFSGTEEDNLDGVFRDTDSVKSDSLEDENPTMTNRRRRSNDKSKEQGCNILPTSWIQWAINWM